jgi:HEAT repeat protein
MSGLIHLSETDLKLDFSNIFIFCLNDPDENIRVQATRGLDVEEEEIIVTPLIKALKEDRSAKVRASAATALGKFALLAELGKITDAYVDKVYSVLLQVLDNEQEATEVKRRALESIAPLNMPRVRELIGNAYRNSDQQFKTSSLYAMGRNCDPLWLETLLLELSNTQPLIRYEAAKALGELGIKEAIPKLSMLTMDEDMEVQEAAIKAIAEIGGSHARRILEKLVKSQDMRISEAAKPALEELTFYEDPISIE